MELWLLACVMLVFLSLLEYSIILWDGVKKRNATNLRLQVTKREKVSFKEFLSGWKKLICFTLLSRIGTCAEQYYWITVFC